MAEKPEWPSVEDECDNEKSSEDSKMLLDELKKAYEEKKFDEADRIVESMVAKSHVVGLNKLHTACGYGLVELVDRYLTKETVNPNVECSFNDLTSITPLHFCAGIGPEPLTPDRHKCIDLLVRHGAHIDHLTSRHDTPLHWATKLADLAVCEALVRLGSDVNKLNMDNCTCAHGAAFYKKIKVLQMLLEQPTTTNKLDVFVKDVSGKTILHLLCKDSYEDYSAESCSSLNEPPTPGSENKKNISKFVQRLLDEYKMNVDDVDTAEFTPLMYACEQENIDLVQTLLDHGANVNVMNKEGVTCMLLAIVNSCPKVVNLLIKSGFDVKNARGNCSYVTDAAYLNDIDILTALIDAGCDPNETKEDENGVILNPLWAACERGNLVIVEYLLSKGARTMIREDLKMTAMHCTAMAQYESLAIAKLLVEHKCEINVKTTQAGETPLFLASNSGFAEIVEYLLELGVNPNESSSETRSCFQQAVFRGHKEIIHLLLKHAYVLTDEDKNDLNLYIMDLYQDQDVEMINFLLSKNLITKEQILDCIKKVHEWQTNYKQEQDEQAPNELEDASLVATLSDLKLELRPNGAYPTTVDQLDVFLATKPNDSNLSDDNEELK